jgi:hypothetical protein
MAKEESEFHKLLSEAPMAPDADTVTVVGILRRTADPARFVLTLPDGQSETLDVAAVKSAKRVAGAIGQSVVELELDAKRVPAKVSEIVNKSPFVDLQGQTIWSRDNTGAADVANTGLADIHHSLPQAETIAETVGTGAAELAGTGAAEAVGATHAFAPMPFAAAMPHQAHPSTMEALMYSANAFSGTRTYLNWNLWTGDHHTIYKAWADPQSI